MDTESEVTDREALGVKRITAVLLVKEIETALPFWVDKLGFVKTIEVPDGDVLGFVSLGKGNTEVMYQTHASTEKLEPGMAEAARKCATFLYIEVDDLDAVVMAMKGVTMVKPVDTTFYGMREFTVQEPGGHYVTFAQPVVTPTA